MKQPYKVLIAEYTLMSFLMTMIVPISLHASSPDTNFSPTEVTISENENPETITGNITETVVVPIEESTNTGTQENNTVIPEEASDENTITPISEPIGTGAHIDTDEIDTETNEVIVSQDTINAEDNSTTSSLLTGTTLDDLNSENNTGSVVIEEPRIENPETITGATTITGTTTENPETITGTTIAPTEIPLVTEIDKNPETRIEKVTEKNPETEILIQFKGDIDSTLGQYQVSQIEVIHDLKTIETIGENNIAVMESNTPRVINDIIHGSTMTYEKFGNEETIHALIDTIKMDPRVAHVQKNFVYTIQSTNDTDYTKLWGLNNEGQNINEVSGEIDADIDYPEAMAYSSGKLGTGVIVAVLDTGIAYNHPDLIGHMWNGTNCISDTGAALGGCIYGYDFGDDDLNPTDSDMSRGHGTHMAGTIGAITNNEIGTLGIAPKVQIMAVKIFGDKTQSRTSSIIRGINFAKYNGAKIINASFGGGQYQPHTENDFDYLTYNAIHDFPGLFVAAAGNNGVETNQEKFFPAGFSSNTIVSGEVLISGKYVASGEINIPGLGNVISVAATDKNDHLASFSNYGTETVDIAAPGVEIYSTYPTVSSEVEIISASEGWNTSGTSNTELWKTSISGEIFTDMHTISGESFYVSGEEGYLEKSFSGKGLKHASVGSIPIWCNTPTSYNTWKDYISIEYSTGGSYTLVKNIDQQSLWNESWTQGVSFSGHNGSFGYVGINSFDVGENFSIRFGWHTDRIDDIDPETATPYIGCKIGGGAFFIERTDDGESAGYQYLQGTSMATPHVAGAAALAWSYKPNASIQSVRDAIMFGGDYKSSLNNIKSSRRLNLLGMLKALETPHITQQKATLSGESIAIIDYASDIETYGMILYATGLNTVMSGSVGILFASAEGTGFHTEHRSILRNLSPDTIYYYRVQVQAENGVHVNPEYYIPYTFRTPKLITSVTNIPVTISGEAYLGGSTGTGITFSGSTSSGRILLINTGSTITVTIPTHGLEITTSGSWNGIIEAPRLISTGSTTITVSGESSKSVQQVFSVGNTETSLILSGQLATIALSITAQNGTIADIYRSPAIGISYVKISNCTIMNNICTFTTNHFSLFAIGNIQSPTTNNGSISGGGGGILSQAIPTKSTPYVPTSVQKTQVTKTVKRTTKAKIDTPTTGNDIISMREQLKNKTLTKSARRKIRISMQQIYKKQIELIKTSTQK